MRSNYLKLHHYLFNKIAKIISLLIKKDEYLASVYLFPVIDIDRDLNRLKWYIPNEIRATKKIRIGYQGKEKKHKKLDFIDILSISQLERELSKDKSTSVVLLNNYDRAFSILFKKYKSIVKIVDKNYYSYRESFNWQTLCFDLLSKNQKIEIALNSKDNFAKLSFEFSDYESAYCFVTGPSFDSFKNFEFKKEKTLNIICNSICKNVEFLEYIESPHIMCFADAVFHFGNSDYAQQFRADVAALFEKYKCFIVLPDTALPLFYYNYPQMRPYLIGIESTYKGRFNIPSENQLWHFNTGNVLSFLMLPIASALVNDIRIFGADGRENNETYFWKHSTTAQYTGLMATAFEEHPSFFRDRDYTDYYDTHCESLRRLIEFGENKNKVYSCITPSFIPALKDRYDKK